jgi:hypothetical protein
VTPSMSGKRIALLVGCSEYEDPKFPQLRAPAQDVEALHACSPIRRLVISQ